MMCILGCLGIIEVVEVVAGYWGAGQIDRGRMGKQGIAVQLDGASRGSIGAPRLRSPNVRVPKSLPLPMLAA